ncbi:MAG: hypothetical protein JKX85_06845 [Phycisphaeraceae bacterium]|nr:hypothetical protein [Phycisphaeraceae bacterium]
MSRITVCFMIVFCGLFLLSASGEAGAQPAGKVDPSLARVQQVKLLSQVTEIFLNRCSECHSEDDAKPKGDFGFVMNLSKLAKSDLIVSGNPEISELYERVDFGDMPPEESDFAPMPDREKKAIYNWIKAGAFAIVSDQGSSVPQVSVMNSSESDEVTPAYKPRKPLYYLLGKLHPFVIHFPIALIFAAGVAELLSLPQRRTGMTSAVTFCLLLGSAGAVLAAMTGWIFAMDQGYAMAFNTETHSLHRWLGVACALLSPMLLWVDLLSGKDRRFVRFCLITVIVIVLAAGHFGGMLIYGEDLFSL